MMVVSTLRLRTVVAIELMRSARSLVIEDWTMFCGTCCGTILTTATDS